MLVVLDENGLDQNWGGIDPPQEEMSGKDCLNWCQEQNLATGCEYKEDEKKCLAHTFSVSSASGDQGSLCSVILPKGLFLMSVKSDNNSEQTSWG